MSDEMRLIQNNMQVIEELHHKIMALEKEIAELKKNNSEVDKILEEMTEGRLLELNAYERLESVLKKSFNYIINKLRYNKYSLEIFNDKDHNFIKNQLKELSAKDDPKHYEGDEEE